MGFIERKFMPKTKTTVKKPEKIVEKKIAKPADEIEKIIEIDEEAKVADDLELIPGETETEDPEDEEAVLDDEEVDPFKDKWEE